MNAPNPIPSPLVPQGSIPPKNTSRSGRVLIIALTVVAFHIAGLGVVLMQGCQKDAKTAGSSSLETNNGLSLPPMDTNGSMFASAPTNGTVTSNAPNPLAGMGATPTGVVAYTPPVPVASAPVGFSEPPTSAPVAETSSAPMTEYKVARGDTLGGIARKHKITLSALTKANPDLDPAKLMPGKTLKVPAAPASAAAPAPATVTAAMGAARPASGAAVTASTYKVKPGDNLTKIARANGITVSQLRAANNIKTSQIHVGQNLKIPARATADAAATTQH